MEDRALEILRTMLKRRGLETKTDRIATDELDRANVYTIGSVLVIFSQKDKGVLDRDIQNYVKFAEAQGYTNGIILVNLAPPSENVLKVVKSYAKDRLQFFHIWQLQFDITQHRMSMPHRILNEDEKTELFKSRNIVNPAKQLPSIDCQDAMIKWIGAIPGDVVEVLRHSDTGGKSKYWRYCVEDVNVV